MKKLLLCFFLVKGLMADTKNDYKLALHFLTSMIFFDNEISIKNNQLEKVEIIRLDLLKSLNEIYQNKSNRISQFAAKFNVKLDANNFKEQNFSEFVKNHLKTLQVLSVADHIENICDKVDVENLPKLIVIRNYFIDELVEKYKIDTVFLNRLKESTLGVQKIESRNNLILLLDRLIEHNQSSKKNKEEFIKQYIISLHFLLEDYQFLNSLSLDSYRNIFYKPYQNIFYCSKKDDQLVQYHYSDFEKGDECLASVENQTIQIFSSLIDLFILPFRLYDQSNKDNPYQIVRNYKSILNGVSNVISEKEYKLKIDKLIEDIEKSNIALNFFTATIEEFTNDLNKLRQKEEQVKDYINTKYFTSNFFDASIDDWYKDKNACGHITNVIFIYQIFKSFYKLREFKLLEKLYRESIPKISNKTLTLPPYFLSSLSNNRIYNSTLIKMWNYKLNLKGKLSFFKSKFFGYSLYLLPLLMSEKSVILTNENYVKNIDQQTQKQIDKQELRNEIEGLKKEIGEKLKFFEEQIQEEIKKNELKKLPYVPG